MKKIWIFIFSMSLFVWACDSQNSDNSDSSGVDSAATAKPDWSNADTLEDMIHSYFFKNTAEKGTAFYQHRNPMNGEVNMMQLTDTKYDSVFQTSENSATMAYNAYTFDNDSLIIDCQFIWDASFSETDKTFGRYKLKTIFVRKKNKKVYYNWQKTGQFWDKVFVEQPKVQ